jgi:hypothetical protein
VVGVTGLDDARDTVVETSSAPAEDLAPRDAARRLYITLVDAARTRSGVASHALFAEAESVIDALFELDPERDDERARVWTLGCERRRAHILSWSAQPDVWP